VKAWFNRAEAKYHDGDFAGAIADYDAVLAMKAEDVESWTGRGHAFFALEKYAEALADYQSVAQQLPSNRECQINLGDAYQELGRWQDANQAYENSLATEPTAVAYQRFAWFKATCPDAEFKDATTAAEMIEKAMKMSGQTPINLDTLAAAQAANGNFEMAKETQQRAIQLTAEKMPKNSVVHKDYQTRMAQYEERVPYQQANDRQAADQ
jgi:tetratricopeptide (TPR) repeat protein